MCYDDSPNSLKGLFRVSHHARKLQPYRKRRMAVDRATTLEAKRPK